ncbi:type IVB secretion system protein IcmV [Legionella spiritensis]|uniref:Intracellular multiplication protein IcmV n=1 Tax=Legionella spiritensis TaxID=452 RepID=A0A0W0Z6D7_LEGSP|nr:type IVB secretion system protein IcmV [Legionella spiritensis]KTD64387.1 intracellular multiplication protein IcmV [Legionella spiritensis]SNV46171.1 intracellular multiplication protein IcmV [Legionella spiritensis]
MKNQSSSRIATVIKSIFNVRKWADYDRMKSFTTYLGEGFKKLFVPQKKVATKSFDNAMSEFHVTEKDLATQKKALFRLSILMCIAATLLFSWGIYHVVNGSLKAAGLSMIVMLIALALAFRYHFWYYQIKERKLGCTLKEWFREGLMGGKR